MQTRLLMTLLTCALMLGVGAGTALAQAKSPKEEQCERAAKSCKILDQYRSMRVACRDLRNCNTQCRRAKINCKKGARNDKKYCKQKCRGKRGKAKRRCKKECRKSFRSVKKECRGAKKNCRHECRAHYKNEACRKARLRFGVSAGKCVIDGAGCVLTSTGEDQSQ